MTDINEIMEIVKKSSLETMTDCAKSILEERYVGDEYKEDRVKITVSQNFLTLLMQSYAQQEDEDRDPDKDPWLGFQYYHDGWFAFNAEGGKEIPLEDIAAVDLSMAAYWMTSADVGTYIPEFESFAPSSWKFDTDEEFGIGKKYKAEV